MMDLESGHGHQTGNVTREQQRLIEVRSRKVAWRKWGPYLSERAWGTVREDYSPDGDAWNYFPHDHARSRAYRWGEDGLGGISDREQHLCFAFALWNGQDPILKERLFGLTGPEGNHGEDVKENYFYLDNTPTHSYMKMLYKYPQSAFPYDRLLEENRRAGRRRPEYELLDTGIFDQDRYFDIFIEYAKADAEDILVRLKVVNRGPEPSRCMVLPTLWFRNTWSWGYEHNPMGHHFDKPAMHRVDDPAGQPVIQAAHGRAGTYLLYADQASDLLFTDNETNYERLFEIANTSPHTKDAFHRYLIDHEDAAVNPTHEGTKAAYLYDLEIEPGATAEIRLRLTSRPLDEPFIEFKRVFDERRAEAEAFYQAVQRSDLDQETRRIQRHALASMLWSKQFYYFDVDQWLDGDPGAPAPAARSRGRNSDWRHLNTFDILSMPDKWEYPWFAAWDLAFHTIPLTLVDPGFAKWQMLLMTRVWYLHPNGELPAYEWAFGDVNPPVHAWASWRIYQMEGQQTGFYDRSFLERIFHKLLLNFNWWVNRKDEEGRNVFQGGFLGLDNISVFDRSAELPFGGHIDQSDATAWMGFYSLNMLHIALELARENPVYQDLATKFFEHFLSIAHAMTDQGGQGFSLWDEEDGFFYDVLHLPDDSILPLRVRSLVGLIPLLAADTLEPELLDMMPDFHRRLEWFARHRPKLSTNMARVDLPGMESCILLAIPTRERLQQVLRYMFDEAEFLSPHGVRSLSKYHADQPYTLQVGTKTFGVNYQPAESEDALFGGNSNWRGPVWFPINFLLIDALQTYHRYYGDEFKVECPTGSGIWLTLEQAAAELARRLMSIFLFDGDGRRPVFGELEKFQGDPHWRDYILFHEYFHGETGAGLGASHQTGWTGLVADLIQRFEI
jgi:hypothetical protein